MTAPHADQLIDGYLARMEPPPVTFRLTRPSSTSSTDWKNRGVDVIGNVAWVILLIILWLLPVITVGYLAIRLRWGRHARTPIA